MSPYVTTRDIAQLLRFEKPDGSPDVHAAARYLERAGIEKLKRGRTVLARREDVEASLRGRTA